MAHDLGLGGIRLCPDLDSAVDALTRSASSEPSSAVRTELDAWGVAPHGPWHHLSDVAFARGIARNIVFSSGQDGVFAARRQYEAAGGPAGTSVVPVTTDPVELHVVETDADGERSRHVQRWLNDPDRGAPLRFAAVGLDSASPAAGVLDAIRTSDLVVVLPMSPVLDAAGLLGVSGVRDALRGTSASVVVLSPLGLRGGRDPEGETAAWQQAQLEPAATSIARLYADFMDRLVIDVDEPAGRYPASLAVERAPLVQALEGEPSAARRLREIALAPSR